MRLFKYFWVFTLLIFSAQTTFANMYAGAYAGVSAGAMIPGQWGGMQACPYMPGGGGGSGNSIASLEAQLEQIEEEIEGFQEEQDELVDGSHERYDDDRLHFKADVAKGLAAFVDQRLNKSMSYCDGEGVPTAAQPLQALLQQGSSTLEYCTVSTSERQIYDADKICNVPAIYADTEKLERYKDACGKFLDRYDKLAQKIEKAEERRDKIERKLDKAIDKQEDAEDKAYESGRPLPPEGVQCLSCMGYPEPQPPSGKQIGMAIGADLVGAAAWYFGTRYVSRNNAKLGWATPPLAMGMPGAYATASLFGNAYGGGMGSGSWGCSPGAGYQWGPNGGYGNPYGNMSPYGACGGAFAGPCGGGGNGYGGPGWGGGQGYGPGFNLGMSGGIFAPGMGPGGMAGPWGGGGMYPGMGGGFGGGLGMGGYPGMGGGFGGGLGMGGYPGMGGGLFPGAYPGGYNMGGGFGGGLGGGMGYPGAYGMNPYGGYGGPFAGIGGGLGLGMPGMGPGMGYPGMPGMGSDYQMQLLNMQIMAQQRALQNAQVVSQQVIGIDMEMAQLYQRRNYLLQMSGMGGMGMGGMGMGLGLGLNFGASLGVGGQIGGLPSPATGSPVPQR